MSFNAPNVDVKIKFLHPVWQEQGPARATDHSAGIDLRACIDQEHVDVLPGQRFPFPSGIAIEICSPGVAGFVFSRSGLGAKDGMTVSQGVGVIDPDYRGEIIVSLLNTSESVRRITRGQRIAQLLFLPYYVARVLPVAELSATARGAGGFGHTGSI